jgi:hypothetical protein
VGEGDYGWRKWDKSDVGARGLMLMMNQGGVRMMIGGSGTVSTKLG